MAEQWSTPSPSTEVPNYLVPAILATIFCCMPLGVVSIIFATQVNSKIAAGDMAGAVESSGKAKMFAMIAVGGGVLIWVCVVVVWVLMFGMAAISNM